MFAVLIILHVLICIFLVLVVLLQASKGAGLAGAFGGGGLGGGMGAVFGGRGAAPFLSKVTTVLAIAFMLSCIVQLKLSPVRGKAPKSVIQQEAEKRARTQPAEALPVVSEEVPAAPIEQPGTESQSTAADSSQQ
ncbi:MAG: preprotein translocase subunit SecG [bacterium]